MKESLKQKLQSIEPSVCFLFKQINLDTVELRIDRQGWGGNYSIGYARRVCRELGHSWKMVFKKM